MDPGSTSQNKLYFGCFSSVLAPIQVSRSVLCAGPSTQCVSPGSSETSWLQPELCAAPAGTGTGMCRSTETKRNPPKTRSSLFEQAQTQQGSSMASVSVSSSSSAAGTNFLMRQARDCFSLTLSVAPSSASAPSFSSFSPSSSGILNLLSSYLCPPSPSCSLCLPLPLTAAAIHTGPPRNVPIPVAGQHYRTTEASNGSLAEQPAIGQLFQRGGAAAM